MAHFYLHLHECGKVLIDEQGRDFENVEGARREAVRTAREIMCAELTDGKLCLACHFEIENADDGTSLTVEFRDTIEITGA